MPDRYILAIDIGGTTIKAELQDESGSACWSARVATPQHAPDAAVQAVLGVVDEAVQIGWQQYGTGPVSIGIASLGLVDSTAGVARLSTAIGWRDVPLRRLVVERTGVPTVLGHDIRAAALAEHASAGMSPLLFVAVGTGVGGALVTGSGAYLGAHQSSVEIGHIPIGGTLECPCGGRGCLETVASAAAMQRAYAARTGSFASARELAASSDPAAIEVWRAGAEALGRGLAVAATLLDPATIVVGGGVAEAGRGYLDLVAASLAEHTHLGTPTPLRPARLGDRAALVGAGLLARSAELPVGGRR